MWFRFFLCWLASKKISIRFLDTLTQSYRVLPHDMSLRDHLPNFRYASFSELGRFQFWQAVPTEKSVGMFNVLVAAQHIIYIRPVRLFSKLELDTRLVGWDKKYFYFRHDFYVKGQLVTTSLVKEAVVFSGKIVEPETITNTPAPESMQTMINAWKSLQTEVQNASDSRA